MDLLSVSTICSLDAQLASSDAAQIVLDVRRDMDALQAKILSSHKQNRPAMRQEMRDLRLSRIVVNNANGGPFL